MPPAEMAMATIPICSRLEKANMRLKCFTRSNCMAEIAMEMTPLIISILFAHWWASVCAIMEYMRKMPRKPTLIREVEINALIGGGEAVWASTQTVYNGNIPNLALNPVNRRMKAIFNQVVSMPLAAAIRPGRYRSVRPPLVATMLRKRIPINAMEIPMEQMNTYFHVASSEVAVRSW